MMTRLSRRITFCTILLLGAVPAQTARAQNAPSLPLDSIAIDGEDVSLSRGVLSPDGRWIVTERWETPNRSSLWAAPAAGGELVRLTDTGYVDEMPAWSPRGERIFFASNRPGRGESGTFIMSLQFDAQTGRAVGAPRQVTLEKNSLFPKPSPDGRQLAYRTGGELRIVPVNGGNSRVVINTPRMLQNLAWEPDGSALYYTHGDPALGGPGLYRVPVAGGTATEVLRVRGKQLWLVSPASRLVVTFGAGPGRDRVFETIDFSGNVRSRSTLSSMYLPSSFSADGRSLIFSSADVGAVMRVRPTRGGEAIDVSDGSDYEWPVSWTADSRSVITHGGRGGQLIAFVRPLDGSAPREVPVPASEKEARWGWGTPTHVSYILPKGEGQAQHIAIEIATGRRSVLTELGGITAPASGPGGSYRNANEFYFTQAADDRLSLMSAAPGSPARTLFTVPAAEARATAYAFAGDRRVFLKMIGDSAALMLADPAGAAPRVLITLGIPDPAGSCCRSPVGISADGQWVALAPMQAAQHGNAIIVRVPASGRATDVRRAQIGAEYWYEPRWLPDNSGFTVIAGTGAAAWVAFVPTAPGEPVRHISREDDGATWGHELSPDGRYVVYPSEVWRGSRLWRMNLEPVLR